MTPEALRAFAQAVVDGGPVKKSEILTFMSAFLALPEATATTAAAPPLSSKTHGPSPVRVERVGHGVYHIGGDAVRHYNQHEIEAFGAELARVAGT